MLYLCLCQRLTIVTIVRTIWLQAAPAVRRIKGMLALIDLAVVTIAALLNCHHDQHVDSDADRRDPG